MDYDRSHVVAEADAFDADEMTFASPLPRPLSPLWAVVRPLEPYVWAAVSATLLVGAVAFVKIGRAEEKAKVVMFLLVCLTDMIRRCGVIPRSARSTQPFQNTYVQLSIQFQL